jgi:hypothetical protein
LNHAKDGRLFRGPGTTPTCALQAPATGLSPGLGDFFGLAFVPGNDIRFIELNLA